MDLTHAFAEAPLPLFALAPDDVGPVQGQEPDRAQAPNRDKSSPSCPADHRFRLRNRLLQCGAAAVSDDELLELILFRAMPRLDPQPLAQRLLDMFGDFNRVISASTARLGQVPGVGPAVITELKIVEASAQRLARARVLNRPVMSGWQALLDYCHTTMAHAETEQFHVLFLDRKNCLITDEKQAQGTVDHVPVYPREIMRRALELNASAIILVHNHPSGDPTPSEADIAMTHQIARAADSLSITLHDHIVIGKSCEISFRSEGLI
ncbi:RadC family protein [Paracoccus tegillarcae]|uniref:MPN domain-containing protein n=1 Tax=Paracoccus tegillarcae TaxID=1529068 RepID=A0A2K9EPA2_9RHOB|nr:DNA repair protein RadC [Paracoccus tegillarcae]AUH33485.1 hypothetical protein CUV01_08875 [Paracoccus tegillarcae]